MSSLSIYAMYIWIKLYMHKNRKLELSENSTIQGKKTWNSLEWREDVTAQKGDVTILPELLYTNYLFLKQPEL